jgi:hypothetical protein
MYICILMQKLSLSEIGLSYVCFSFDAIEVGMSVLASRALLCSAQHISQLGGNTIDSSQLDLDI